MKLTAQGFAVMDDDKDTLLSRYVEQTGRLDHDAGIAVHYLTRIKPGDVCVDAGAAIGDHTIAYAQKAGDARLIHAFECNPNMLECLYYNVPLCHIHPFALSDKHETLFFHADNQNAGASYVDRDSNAAVPVPAVKLDSYCLPKVDFIKWDLEGYELKAIHGARDTILRCRPIMMIEVIEGQLTRAGNSISELFVELERLRYRFYAVLGKLGGPEYFELCCEPL